MIPLLGAKSCRSCEYHFKQPGGGGVLACRRYPPAVVFIAIPGPDGAPNWITNSVFPPINPDIPCGEYKRNELMAQAELAQSTKGVLAN